MEKYVITITRQFGSLGRPIAARLSEILNIEYYDREIVERTARQMGETVAVIGEEEERAKKGFAWMKIPFGFSTTDKQDEIFQKEQKIIEQFAAKQSCIVVGRCSDYVLREYENAIHIYIYAPFEARLKNCVETLKMEKQEAKRTIQAVDKMRDIYHKTYAGFLPSDIEYKNLMIDSSLLGVEGTAEYIARLVRKKFGMED